MLLKAVVTGATGLLGREVKTVFEKAGWKVVGTGFTRANPPSLRKLDLADDSAVSSLLDEVKPQVVVHCAANRSPDSCDADPAAARAINVDATAALAKAAASRHIFLIYISTDYVFAGAPGEAPYEVSAATAPPNLYGQTKLDGEKAMLRETAHSGKGVVLRVPVLYGQTSDNSESAINVLLEKVREAQEEGKKIKMDDWAKRYPTCTEDVGRVCKDIAVKYLEAGEDRGKLPTVLQFSAEDCWTKYGICEFLAEINGLHMEGLVADKGGPSAGGVQRPYDTHLSTKVLKGLGVPVWTQDFKGWWKWELDAVRH